LNTSDAFAVFLEGVYAISKDRFDPFNLPLPEGIPEEVRISPDRDPTKGAYDYSMIQEYSDLDYRRLDTTLGLRWTYSPRASVTGSVTWMNIDDKQPYVYSDLSGSVVVYAAGATVKF
jgi:hypothetical protein